MTDIMHKKTKQCEFMETVAIEGSTTAFSPSFFVSLAEESAKPDILLIMPDQMRGDCLSILNYPAVRTP
ncbi:MAG: hypothetical protein K8S55_11270 [Phycisphaerae bacterium]|nr:hypothetical protein [Phycisphaerae bacterium]